MTVTAVSCHHYHPRLPLNHCFNRRRRILWSLSAPSVITAVCTIYRHVRLSVTSTAATFFREKT
jgi:hypothetical protein